MGNSASSLPYSIGKQVIPSINDGWSFHEGNRKSDGLQVSVFVAKKPTLLKTPISRYEPNITQYSAAKHHYINCKKLRHPYIIQVYATLDTDNPNDTSTSSPASGNNAVVPAKTTSTNEVGDFVIVTESCIPLDEWLQKSNPSTDEIAWGLECMVKALNFLHTSLYFHGNVVPTSFYVTKSGDVKLWNFSLTSTASNMTPHFITYEHLITPDLYRSPERKEKRYDSIINYGIHIYDSYSLGMLIDHLYAGNIPTKLTKAVQRLQTINIKMRPKLLPLLKCPIFDTQLQHILLQIDELHIQPIEMKISFYNTILHPILTTQSNTTLPSNIAIYKIIPLISRTIETICTNESMKTQDMYRREGKYIVVIYILSFRSFWRIHELLLCFLCIYYFYFRFSSFRLILLKCLAFVFYIFETHLSQMVQYSMKENDMAKSIEEKKTLQSLTRETFSHTFIFFF